jgi:hypothetical protein
MSAGVLVSPEGSSVAEAGDSTELTVTVIRCRFRLLGLLISAANGATLAGSWGSFSGLSGTPKAPSACRCSRGLMLANKAAVW